jgi:hypothetical protein
MPVYADAELEIALDSETIMSWLRPVIGFVEHAARLAANASAEMRKILMDGILMRRKPLRCNRLLSTGRLMRRVMKT